MDIHITVPRAMQVVANGRRVSRTVHGGRATTHWRAVEPMVPYLAYFAAGTSWSDRAATTACRGTSRCRGSSARAARARSMRLMRRTPGWSTLAGDPARRLPVLHDRRADHRPGPGVRAREPDPADVPRDGRRRPGHRRARARAPVVRRLVAVENWRDIWLNEGFATFMEVQYDATHGGRSARAWLSDEYNAYGPDDDLWNLTIADPGRPASSTSAVYVRGAMALQALRQRIGDDGLLDCCCAPGSPRTATATARPRSSTPWRSR